LDNKQKIDKYVFRNGKKSKIQFPTHLFIVPNLGCKSDLTYFFSNQPPSATNTG